MRMLETIEDDIFAVKAFIQEAIRAKDEKELESLYIDLDVLEEEYWNLS